MTDTSGCHGRIRNAVDAEGAKRCVGSMTTRPFDKLRAGSCKKRKDAAPSTQMAHKKIIETWATRRIVIDRVYHDIDAVSLYDSRRHYFLRGVRI
jgi:hypothetical protein